jgi:hypothetical protein
MGAVENFEARQDHPFSSCHVRSCKKKMSRLGKRKKEGMLKVFV